MKKLFRLSPAQWKVLSSAFSNISQAIILFSLASFFVPEAVSLPQDFSKEFAVWMLISGLLCLLGTVIISKERRR